MEDVKVIQSASSGLALCGVCKHGSKASRQRLRPVKQVLKCPSECQLHAPMDAHIQSRVEFGRQEEMALFLEVAKVWGWSAALKSFPLITAQIGQGASESKSRVANASASERWTLEICFAPVRSFRIERQRLELSDEAVADLRGVSTLSQAKEFLEQYHSHVSTGVFHLGGIYAKWTMCGRQAQESSSSAKHLTELTGGAGINDLHTGIGAGIGVERQKHLAATEQASHAEDSRFGETRNIGGPTGATKNSETFLKALETDPSSWAIINRDCRRQTLVEVWDPVFTAHDESLQKPAELLRNAWQSAAAEVIDDEEIIEMLQESLSKSAEIDVPPPTTDGRQYKTLVEAGLLNSTAPSQTVVPSSLPPSICWVPQGGSSMSNAEACLKMPSKKHDSKLTEDDMDDMLGSTESMSEPLLLNESMSKKPSSPPAKPETSFSFETATHQREQCKHKPPKPKVNEMLQLPALMQMHVEEASGSDAGQDTRRCPQFTYIDDFLTHRPFPQQDKYRNLIDRISHALPLFENFKLQPGAGEETFWSALDNPGRQDGTAVNKPVASSRSWYDAINFKVQSFIGGGADVDKDCLYSSQELDLVVEEAEAAGVFVYIYKNSDFLGQIALLRLLLDQRWGVPLVFSSDSSTEGSLSGQSTSCFHTIQALSSVIIKIGGQSTNAQDMLLAHDMLRVVFLSDHCDREHERMAELVTKFRFLPFSYGADDGALYIQVGISFLPRTPQEKQRRPYLAVVVSGACTSNKQCISFINEVADVIFVQVRRHNNMGNNVRATFSSLLTCETMLRWTLDSAGRPGGNKATSEIWGSYSDVATLLIRYLNSNCSKLFNNMRLQESGRRHLKSICESYFEAPQVPDSINHPYPEGLEDTLKHTDFGTLRNELVLQTSFKREAIARFEILKLPHNNAEVQKKLKECIIELEKREQDARKVAEIPIVQIFLRVLQHTESSARSMGIVKLKNFMEDSSHRALVKSKKVVDSAFKKFQSTPTPESKGLYHRTREQHAGKVIRMEHLWREVSHIFLADPRGHLELPKLAARHLLDGFPLEILDGDAKFFNDVWVKAVLLETEQLIMMQKEDPGYGSPPRVFVLSILGTQSSGKTTLLNAMFGTNLPTKAGRCTSGVHIQLIKSQWQHAYDYVLLMDTEGIKAPEHYGTQDYLMHDNRTATIAILSSDACIMVIAGEDDSNLKDVLPLVLLAFKGSTAAQKCGGRLRSKMLFVYRSVDINEQDELKSNQQTLLGYLVEAQRFIVRPAHGNAIHGDPELVGDGHHTVLGGGQQAWGSGAALFDFRVDDTEDLSDVKFLGNYRRDSTPPEDIPDSKYGEKVLQLRDYLHRRVTEDPNWVPFDFKQLGSYMNLVWSCILEADFELSFKSCVEYSSYMELQQMLQHPRTLVSRSYVEELEEMESRVDTTSLNTSDTSSLDWLQFSKVQTTISEQTKRVEEVLQNNRWLSLWKGEELQKWKDFLEQQGTWFKLQLYNHKTGVVFFEKLVTDCDRQMQQDLLALRGLPADKQPSFDDMFSAFLEGVKQLYKPSADSVKSQVDKVYSRHKGVCEYSSQDLGAECSERDEFEEMSFADLQERILEPFLKNARQYSDDLVEGAISSTCSFIDKHPLAYDEMRQRRAQTHAKVKIFVTQELHKIQQKWDEDHNPAARLEKQRDRFHHLYNIHRHGYDMANLLLEELKVVFTESLEITLKQSLVHRSCFSLRKEPWLLNWKVMSSLLNALLLKLLQVGKYDQVLDYVSEGGDFHSHVVEMLLKINLEETIKTSLPDFRVKIKDAVSCASTKAMTIGAAGAGKQTASTIFLDNLIEMLASWIPAASSNICVALQRIGADITSPADSGGLGFSTILTPELHATVDEICDAVEKQVGKSGPVDGNCDHVAEEQVGIASTHGPIPDPLRDLADMVQKRLIAHDNLSYRTRCEKECPLCGSMCSLPADHSVCHDTMHQPQGLKGLVYEQNMELSDQTCRERFNDPQASFIPGSSATETKANKKQKQKQKLIPYRNFNKQYPDWENPLMNYDLKDPLACKVRQCLFALCQEQLVRRYPRSQPNQNCAHFAHSIPRLLYVIEQELPPNLRTFIDKAAAAL